MLGLSSLGLGWVKVAISITEIRWYNQIGILEPDIWLIQSDLDFTI